MPTDAPKYTYDYFDFLNLVEGLYSETTSTDTDGRLDRQRLVDWAAAVTVFQTLRAGDTDFSVTTDTEFGEELWLTSTYHQLLILVSRRYYTTLDPKAAKNRFDYGHEYQQRTAIREDLRKLFNLIEEFYHLNAHMLVTQSPDESSTIVTHNIATSDKLPQLQAIKPASASFQNEEHQPIPIHKSNEKVANLKTPYSPLITVENQVVRQQKSSPIDDNNSSSDHVYIKSFDTQDKEDSTAKVKHIEVRSSADDEVQAGVCNLDCVNAECSAYSLM